ncbi:GNAT family N-acetyltransferase [Thiolapillus brandeum]|uniref:N-acetyltransferase domain-containing protein n=1 Tax=Thiolapillus brandeum TaxID=1076588 RepID=A0A7U6GL05_9GAMM|nr:GNAT family N-acetyltransferase [Thiolapillus brandeum]BAO45449.1 hypothetical protein TBH_C2543 [Thiolapillus brandeum]
MNFKIVLADKNNAEHRRAIQKLWDNNLHYIGAGRYEWLYFNNPAGETITCLAVTEDGEIVGMASAMRRDFYLHGKCYTACVAIDFAIDSEYRVFGPALQLQRTLAEQAWEQDVDFLMGFPNLASQGILKRVGYTSIGESIRFTQVIRTYSKLIPRLNDRRLPVWLAGPLSAVLDVVLSVEHLVRRSRGSTTVGTSLGQMRDQWQQLWRSNRDSRIFQGKHDADYIEWRYVNCPYQDYQLFCLHDGEQNLVAFLVFSIREKVVLIDDFRYLDEAWLSTLFRRFWKAMRPGGNVAVNMGLLVSREMKEKLVCCGFTTRPSKRWGGVLSNPDRVIEWEQVLGSGEWYITDGEIDL